MLRFAGTVHYAAHDRDFHLFDAGVVSFPYRHLVTQVGLNLLGHFLEERAGRAAATGTRRHLGREAADAERLQNLLSHTHFFSAISAWGGCERNPDRVADAFLEPHAERGARRDDAFGSHAGLGKPKVQGITAARRQGAVDVEQFLYSAYFRTENVLVGP